MATTDGCDSTRSGVESRSRASLIAVAAQPSPATDPPGESGRRGRSRLLAVAAVLVMLGVVAGALVVVRGHSASRASQSPTVTPPPVTWLAGARAAPNFRLVDQRGASVSLRSFRGRTTIVTFLDPLCRNVCPLEARVLADAIRGLPPAVRPAIVAVSVNPRGDTRANFDADSRHWRLTPDWRWAIGSRTQLAAVWRKYEIEVKIVTKRLSGVTVREVEHGDAAFIVDRSGYQRAMFLYPFTAVDVEHELRKVAGRT